MNEGLVGIQINNVEKIVEHFVNEQSICTLTRAAIRSCEDLKRVLYVWLYVTLSLLRLCKCLHRHRWSACQSIEVTSCQQHLDGERVAQIYTPRIQSWDWEIGIRACLNKQRSAVYRFLPVLFMMSLQCEQPRMVSACCAVTVYLSTEMCDLLWPLCSRWQPC